jgi:hypothetical protein
MVVGLVQAKAGAYSINDLTAAGWTKITSISQSDIGSNYYIFLSEDEELMLGLSDSEKQGTKSAFYQALADPATDDSKIWLIEANGANFAMRNLSYTSLQLQTEWSGSSNDLRWRTNDQPNSISWTGLGITAIPEGKFTLTSTQYNRPLGIYNNGTGTPVEGDEIGANDADNGQNFCIYAIPKSALAPHAGVAYYLYNVETGLFLSRGAGYGTAAWADNFGIPVKLIANGNGYRLQYLDQSSCYVGEAYWSWADSGEDKAQTYTLTQLEDGYKLVNTAHGSQNLTLYINSGAAQAGYTHQIASNGSYEIGGENIGNTWRFLTTAERDAIVAKNKAQSEAAIAEKFSYTLTEGQSLNDLVSDADVFASENKTSSVTNAALSENINGWTYTSTNGGNPGAQAGVLEVYQGSGYLKQTISDLAPGIYKVTLNAYYRDGSNGNCSSLSNVGWKLSNAYLEANGNQTMIADWASDRASDSKPNSRSEAKELFDQGKYLNEVYAVVGNDGKLDIVIGQPGAAVNSRWFCYSKLTLTYYTDQVSEEQANEISQQASNLLEQQMKGTVKEALTTAYGDFSDNQSIAYYNVLSSAVEAAEASAEKYAAMKSLIDEATGIIESDVLTNGKDDLTTALQTAQSAYNTAETDMNTEPAALQEAINACRLQNVTVITGKYYVQNVESGLLMAAGHNWGTRGIVNELGLDLMLEEQSGNTVSFDSRVANSSTNHYLGNGDTYMDAPRFGWYIIPMDEETYCISNGTKYIGVDNDNNLTLSEKAVAWAFLEADEFEEERYAANMEKLESGESNDATFLIKQQNFNRNDQRNYDSWSVSKDCTNRNLAGGGDNGNGCAESFHSKFVISQKLSDIPNGIYELTAQGFYRQDDNATEDAPVFFANDMTAEVPVKDGSEGDMTAAGASFLKGTYTIDPIQVTVIDGTLEVGVKTAGTHQWVIFDNFTLKFISPLDVAYSIEGLEENADKQIIFNGSLEVLNNADGEIIAQDASIPQGIKIKDASSLNDRADYGNSIDCLLLGSYNAESHEFTIEENGTNKISTVDGSATVLNMAVAEATDPAKTYLLVKIENATITEQEGEFFATVDGDEIKIDKRLDEGIKVNDGDLVYEITGITFMDGEVNVLAPLSREAVVDNKAEALDGESFAQGDKVTEVEGMLMTYGGNDPEGAQYEFAAVDPEVANFGAVTEGIDQLPVDDEGNAYDKDKKNVPTQGTYYEFLATKDGQLVATIGLEEGKTVIMTEDGEQILKKKVDEDFEGSLNAIPVEATKTYLLFSPDSNLKFFGFTFTPNDINANNIAKDIATFKLLANPEVNEGDTLLLKDAIVTYIKGDNVYVEDASGAIDFYRTKIQYYVGQKLNGYIIGKNDNLEYMPVLLRTDATKHGQFKVTENVKPEATAATIADVTNEANLARFMKLEFVELTNDAQGFKVLANPETGESVLLEDRFGVFYTTGDLFEKVEGIVGMNKEGNFAFWPTSQEGIVISDGFTKNVETELDVTNKEEAKDKDKAVKGISVTLVSNCNAGSGNGKVKTADMTSNGYKLRTNNGSGDKKNNVTFTVNEGQKVFDMKLIGIANYAAKDAEKPCITVTKVEVDGQEVSFEGGEFLHKDAGQSATLTLKGINAEKEITIWFDNSNAEGTQINACWEIVCRGEKVYTTKEKDLLAEAKKLAEDREAVAVGCLDDAIAEAEAGNTSGLKKAVDQFKADNAESSIDYTDKVGMKVENWVNVQGGEDFKTYDGNGVTLVQVFGVTGEGNVLTQDVEVENGTYYIGLYATSHNAWEGKYGKNTAGKPTLQEDNGSVAYVFGTSGDNTVKTMIVARRNSGLIEKEPEIYNVNGLQVNNGKITLGLALAQAAMTEWHCIQIASLKKITNAKAAYAAEKAKLVALLEQANELLSGDQFGGRAKLEAAVADANEAKESIRLNIEGMAEEVAKLSAAIEKFKAAGKVFIQNVATGKYLAAGANWGTHAVLNNTGLDFEITTNSDGTKNFDSQVSNGGNSHFLNGEFVDGASFGWTLAEQSNGNFTISNGTQYLMAGDDDLVVLGDNADEWRFITVDERTEALAAATSSAPVDATFLIKGANFGRNDQRNSAWEVSKDCTNKNLSGGEKSDGSMGNNCAESYHSTFTISQLVADAPAGTYVLTVQGFYRQDGDSAEDLPVYFANDEKQEFGPLTGTENSMTDAGYSFKDGNYAMEPITVIVEEGGTLTIGVTGTAKNQWVIWDNFQLKYYGVGGTPTFIDEAKVEPARSFEQGAVYNLRGQKVANSTEGLKKGLYIVNGKKVVIK